jgi:succinate dehydrogenase assembly factor 2
MQRRTSWLLRHRYRAAATAPMTTTTRRTYLGGAGEGVAAALSDEELALYQIAKPRSVEILARYERLPDLSSVPKASLATTTTTAGKNDDDAVRRKRLIYRAKQRGWLEVDLLLGTWASQNVMTLNSRELDEFEAFVNLETIDIYNLVTLRVPAREFLASIVDNKSHPSPGTMVERIQTWAKSNPLGKADPEAYQKVKTEANLI